MRRVPRTRRLTGRWLAAALIVGAVALLAPGVSYATAGRRDIDRHDVVGLGTPASLRGLRRRHVVPEPLAARQERVELEQHADVERMKLDDVVPHRLGLDGDPDAVFGGALRRLSDLAVGAVGASSDLAVEVLLVRLAQRAPQHLARRVPGQRLHPLDAGPALVMGQPLAAEGDQLLGRGVAAGPVQAPRSPRYRPVSMVVTLSSLVMPRS